MKNWIVKHYSKISFLVIFITLLVGRLSIQGVGYLEDGDEIPFLKLLEFYDRLIVFDPSKWNFLVINMLTNYVEVSIRLVETFFLKLYANWLSIPETSPQALIIMGLFNVLVSMSISYFFYKILLRLDFKTSDALLGVFLAGTLLNTNLYTRHILPYETSLLFHLISIYIVLAPKVSYKKIFFAGFFCALGYFNYYGNFVLLFIAWVLLMLVDRGSFKRKILSTFLLSLPCFLFLFFLEWVSSLTQQSYMDFLIFFSKTVYHGSTEEGLVYIFRYFSLVEGYWGVFLLVISFGAIFYSVFYKNVISIPAKRLFQIAVFFYIVYGLQAVLTGGMVFYGRVLHLYYPFLIIGVLLIINVYPKTRRFFLVGAFVNFLFVINNLNSISYPRTIKYEKGLFELDDNIEYKYEIRPIIVYDENKSYVDTSIIWPIIKMQKIKPSETHKGQLLLLNFCFFYNYPDDIVLNSYQKYKPNEKLQLLYSGSHFMSHPAYTFEYFTKYGRDFFLEKKFKVEVYKKINN